MLVLKNNSKAGGVTSAFQVLRECLCPGDCATGLHCEPLYHFGLAYKAFGLYVSGFRCSLRVLRLTRGIETQLTSNFAVNVVRVFR